MLVPTATTFPRALLLQSQTVTPGAACSLDEDGDGCAGLDLRHEGDPHRCVDWRGDCLYCGIVKL
jgi:hypothetical protein